MEQFFGLFFNKLKGENCFCPLHRWYSEDTEPSRPADLLPSKTKTNFSLTRHLKTIGFLGAHSFPQSRPPPGTVCMINGALLITGYISYFSDLAEKMTASRRIRRKRRSTDSVFSSWWEEKLDVVKKWLFVLQLIWWGGRWGGGVPQSSLGTNFFQYQCLSRVLM